MIDPEKFSLNKYETIVYYRGIIVACRVPGRDDIWTFDLHPDFKCATRAFLKTRGMTVEAA